MISRHGYIPKEREAEYIRRDARGVISLKLISVDDHLALTAAFNTGVFINPKGPGIRAVGLCSSGVRGNRHYEAAFRAADLRAGRLVELRRDPTNGHDKNAIQLHSVDSTRTIGYVQRGRAPRVAQRIDAGEQMVGVCLWGPRARSTDTSALLLIGARRDIEVMLD